MHEIHTFATLSAQKGLRYNGDKHIYIFVNRCAHIHRAVFDWGALVCYTPH